MVPLPFAGALVVAVAAMLLLASGCGDGDGTGSAGQPTPTTTAVHKDRPDGGEEPEGVRVPGLPDPCSLIDREKVATLLGEEVEITARKVPARNDAIGVGFAEPAAECTWSTPATFGPSIFVTVASSADFVTLSEELGSALGLGQPEPIEGLGDEAVLRNGVIDGDSAGAHGGRTVVIRVRDLALAVAWVHQGHTPSAGEVESLARDTFEGL